MEAEPVKTEPVIQTLRLGKDCEEFPETWAGAKQKNTLEIWDTGPWHLKR